MPVMNVSERHTPASTTMSKVLSTARVRCVDATVHAGAGADRSPSAATPADLEVYTHKHAYTCQRFITVTKAVSTADECYIFNHNDKNIIDITLTS